MDILLLLIPLSIVLVAAGVAAFVWAVRDGQFDGLEEHALRVLDDDVPPPADPPGPH